MTPTNAEKRARAGTTDRDGTGTIAFFSMEVALDDSLPTFSGGLGVLAGDFLRSAADLALPVVAVTLLYRKGYFVQHLDPSGHQSESPVVWKPEKVVELLPERTSIEVSGRTVALQAWVSTIRGCSGHEVPLYLLDTDLPENDPED
ncbi:MAG: glycogen/starch/alpha-glucan phosphorylase, partial [Nitrososphaerales archaeon]